MNTNKHFFAVRLNKVLLQTLKDYCRAEDIQIQKAIADGIKLYLKKEGKKVG